MNQIISGDCLLELPKIKSKSIDMILSDLPYEETARNHWDKQIDADLLFFEFRRIIKPNGVICLTATNPYASELVSKNKDIYKYEWVFQKSRATNFLNVKKQPLRKHELVLIFYSTQPIYNPQKNKGLPYNKGNYKTTTTNYNKNEQFRLVQNVSGDRYPIDCIYFSNEKGIEHPTQKPVKLFEYLVKTYTSTGDLVLDCCAGSGTTAIACINTNRKYICIEKDQHYFTIMESRIRKSLNQMELLQ